MLRSRSASTFCRSESRLIKCKTIASVGDSQSANFQVDLPFVVPIVPRSAPRRVSSAGCSRPLSAMPPRSSINYRWIDGVERLELYEPGGYHPVMVDDLLHNRYRMVDKLGFGGYSTVWLARDEMVERWVAVKIGISSSPPVPRRETEILRALLICGSRPASQHGSTHARACAALPGIFDEFEVRGPNGTHACYTLTPAQGSLKEASFNRLFPIQVARALAAKLTTAVAFVHSRGFVHGGLSVLLHLRLIIILPRQS